DISTSGALPDGYSLVSSEAGIEEVEIIGTSDVLDSIDSMSTEEIPLDDMKEAGTVEASLNLQDGALDTNEAAIEVTFELETIKIYHLSMRKKAKWMSRWLVIQMRLKS